MPITDNISDDNKVENATPEFLTIYRKVNPENEIAIMQKRLAAFLLLKNCKLTNVGRDKKEPWRSIFFFEKGSKLDEAMLQYRSIKDKLAEFSKM